MMETYVADKVAVVTGGAAGIGLSLSEELLRNGAKGVCIADIDRHAGELALVQMARKYDYKKVLFVQTDVTRTDDLQYAFAKTAKSFGQLDAVINNAGTYNDSDYEQEISLNMTAVVTSTILALEEYLPRFKSTPDAVVVNMADLAGILCYVGSPIYSACNASVIHFGRCVGNAEFYEMSKVRVLTVCPGFTSTKLHPDRREIAPQYQHWMEQMQAAATVQTPGHVAREIVHVMDCGRSGSVWIVEGERAALEYQVGAEQLSKGTTPKRTNWLSCFHTQTSNTSVSTTNT